MSAPEYPIRVTDLDAGGKDYRFTIRPAWVRGALEGHEAGASDREGALGVRASKSGHDVVVHGALDATLTVPCARCLEPFALPVHADLSVLYVPASSAKTDEATGEKELDLDDGEADTLPYDGEIVVLDDLVRDELVLAVPMIPLCSEGCPGMSPAPSSQPTGDGKGPHPGDERSPQKDIDPRLLPLLAFKGKATK